MYRGGTTMNKVFVGLGVSGVGILLLCLTIFNVLPLETKALKIAGVAVSWVFIIIGSVMRFKALKAQQGMK